jgi:hypothetical protein
MFSQVLGTLLRLTEEHAARWLPVRGSHPVPVYGFERYGEPPPLEVDVVRLLESFSRARVSNAEAWEELMAAEQSAALRALAEEAAAGLDASTRADTPSGVRDTGFHFPDELWARVVYDLALASRDRRMPVDRIVAALVPIYFGRVAGLVLETWDLGSEQAETVVERQARAFELAKPAFVERWLAARPARRAGRGRLVPRTPPPRMTQTAPRRRQHPPGSGAAGRS